MPFFSSDSFYILSKAFLFVKNFFIFLFRSIWHFSCPPLATACLYYHIQIILSTTFFRLIFNLSNHFNQECPASASSLLFRSFVALSAVPQRRMYLTMPVLNCQYFYIFHAILNILIIQFMSARLFLFTIITDTALYSRKFFQEPKESARIWQMHTDSFTDLYCKLTVLTRHFIRVLIKNNFTKDLILLTI